MTTTFKRLLMILAALSLLSLTVSTAFAQDEGEAEGAGDEAPAEDAGDAGDAGDDAGDAGGDTAPAEPTLTEEQMDYVAISSIVACYNRRVSDAKKAEAAINEFLASEGMDLAGYQSMEKKFRGDAAVQDAIKAEMELCDTKVLAMPEEAEPEEELTEDEKKELEEAEKENKWTYGKKTYKATVSKGGVSGGRFIMAFKRNGKTASGNFSGKHKGSGFALGFKGSRKGNKITLRGSSGSKNSATVDLTFKKITDKDGYEHYSKASGKFKGKINGRAVSFSFDAKSKTGKK